MRARDWQAQHARALTVFLNGEAISEPGTRGERITDDSFLLMFNAGAKPQDFTIPAGHGAQWRLVVDTARADVLAPGPGRSSRQVTGWR
ncbi:glycogen operon protein GlgX [Streptomyces avidinii]